MPVYFYGLMPTVVISAENEEKAEAVLKAGKVGIRHDPQNKNQPILCYINGGGLLVGARDGKIPEHVRRLDFQATLLGTGLTPEEAEQAKMEEAEETEHGAS